jgi:SAM-dependent methyltransferase
MSDEKSLTDAWEENAADWTRWARAPGHDSYWRFHRDAFLSLLPRPGRLTLDLGCGEGRLARDLKALGHTVLAFDSSVSMVETALAADPDLEVVQADASRLPLPDGAADLAVAFMSLMDMDDMDGSVREAARVVEPGGTLVLAVVHPVNSAGAFADREDADSPFVISESYFERRRYADTMERDGLRMRFESRHWTLEDYFEVLFRAGFTIDAVREVTDESHPLWRRLPCFLHLRAARGNADQPG